MGTRLGYANTIWAHGLTVEQAAAVRSIVYGERAGKSGVHGTMAEGWTIVRSPTTIYPPTMLKVRLYDSQGLVKEWQVTPKN